MAQWLTKIMVLTLVAVAAGFLLGRRHPGAGHGKRQWGWSGVAVAAVAAWYCSAWFARKYADYDIPLWSVLEWWAHSGKWHVFMGATVLGIGFAAGSQPAPRSTRTSASIIVALVLAITLTSTRTMPIHLAMKKVMRRDVMGIIRQSSSHTCGPVSLANYLERCQGRTNVTECAIARLSGTTVEGTTSSGLLRAARGSGLRTAALRMLSFPDLERLNKPAIVSISTMPSVHHATLLWKIAGDKVHLIDPDYGYEIKSRDWFEDVWYGRTLVLE